MFWDISPDAVEWKDGKAWPAGANAGSFEPLPLAEIALKSGRTGGPISAEVSVNAQVVVISGQAARRFTGGVTELEVEANNFRRLILELDRRFPGLGHQVDESMAVAIDGEIFQDAYLAPLRPESEMIYLIPKIGGG